MASNATCPPASEIVYSPFKPFSQSEYFTHTHKTDNACWWWIICLLSSADEARKKQFDATSLVMGLIPLTLKDVAWPERRLVHVSRHLPKHTEVVVRALGVVPSIGISSSPDQQATVSTSLYGWANKLSYRGSMLLVAISALGLVMTYAALAIIETYSQRSSLGCVYPIFIAIVPAGLETVFPRNSKRERILEMLPQPASESSTSSVGSTHVEQHEHAPPNATISQSPGRLC